MDATVELNELHPTDTSQCPSNQALETARLEQARLKEALQASELRYLRLIEELPEPVLVHVDRRIAHASASAARLLGCARPEDLIGRSITEFATSSTLAQIEGRMTVAFERGEPLAVAMQSFLRESDGGEVHVEVKSIPIIYRGRQAMLSIARDMTASVLAEREAAMALHEADLGRRKLEAVLAALPVGVWIADAYGKVIDTNPAAARIWGGRAPRVDHPSEYGVYKASWTATGKPLKPEDWAMARTLATGATIRAEGVDIERFDGTRGYGLSSSAPILDDEGRMVGGVSVIIDVTEKREAVRERERLIASLEFERRRIGALLEKAPAFIAVLRGKNHVFEFANEAYYAIVGRREIIGKPMTEALPELRGKGFDELLDAVLETGEPFVANGIPIAFNKPPGEHSDLRYVNFVYQPLVEADGTRSGVFVHGIDVTDATLAEQRIRAQFHGVPVPTYVWQRTVTDGKKTFVLVDFNKAALAASGGVIAKHLGDDAAAYFSDAPAALLDLTRCLDDGLMIQREMDQTLPGGHEARRLFVTYAAAPPDLVIVHAEDITERTKLERQFRQAQKMEAVGRLAGGIAHDFNNLLSVILSYADLTIDELAPGNPMRDDIEQIKIAGQRATDLTRQLLAFSRQQVLQPRVFDINQIVVGMEVMLRRLIGEDVELIVSPCEEVGRVLADPGQIEQVVMNLVLNARDAMPDGGKLTVETGNVLVAGQPPLAAVEGAAAMVPGDFVQIAIRDTGTGMNADTRAHLFEPFFTTKDPGKGTGLGLATVRGIVEQSGGQIRVESELGRGSTFIVYLPRTHDASHAPPKMAPAVLSGSETILLVEDEEQVRTVACAILRRHGYHVLATSSGREACLVSRDFPAKIHLMLTDVVMPRMNGRTLASELAAQRPQMKVVFASGYADGAIVQRGVLDAGVAFLQKPFTPDALLRAIREALDS